MGASYTAPLEDKIIEAISGSDFRGELVFLSWDATKGRAELISQKMKKSCTSVEVLNATKTVEDYLCWCDLAIGAGGMSSWERCCLSVPSILTVISDNQLDNAIALSDLGAAHIFDWRTSINTQGLTESINSFIAESESLQLMGNSACAIVDGFGPRRIAEEFLGNREIGQDGMSLIIGIVDYGLANMKSVINAFDYLEQKTKVAVKGTELTNVDALVLPGVGAFDKSMEQLRARGHEDALNELVLYKNKPILGICLGMQLFCNGSEEGLASGLGWINTKCIKFDNSQIQ